MSTSDQVPVRIIPSSIPDSEYDCACAVLASSIRLALMNEDNRMDFDAWKAKRAAQAASKSERK